MTTKNRTSALFLLALGPAALWAWGAFAGAPPPFARPKHIGLRHGMQAAGSDDPAAAERARVLAAMPNDTGVLINVTGRELPASPDILNLGQRSTKALERCLSDNVDAGVRILCATLLGRLGDRRALGALRVALDDWEPSVRGAVIRALSDIPDPASFEPLMKILRRKDEEARNRLVALDALGAISSPKAVQVLRAQLHRGVLGKGKQARAAQVDLEDDDEGLGDARVQAFSALWRSRHLMSRTTLVEDVAYALGSDNQALQLAATSAAAELRAPRLGKALVPLLSHPNTDVRNKAVYALGRIGDKTATAALLAALPKVREARMLNNIAFALERLDRPAFYDAIKDVIKHKQAIIRLNAAFVVGDVKRPEGLPLLARALEDASDYVKTSAVVALGKIGTPQAQALLEKLVDHPNLALRQEAIYALHALSGGKRADLIHDKLFDTRNEAARRRAALALGDAGDPRAREYLLSCLELRRCTRAELDGFLRASAGDPEVQGRLLLSWVRGRRDVTDLLALMRPPGTLQVAESSVQAALARSDLGTARSATELVGDLVATLGPADATWKARLGEDLRARAATSNTSLRVRTEVALARLGDAEASKALLSELDNMAQDALPAFSRAVSRIEEPAARERLLPGLAEREHAPSVNVALAAAAVRLRWAPDQAFFRFLDALSSPSVRERDLAEAYLRHTRAPRVTWLLRRALARETREFTRDRLRTLLDARG